MVALASCRLSGGVSISQADLDKRPDGSATTNLAQFFAGPAVGCTLHRDEIPLSIGPDTAFLPLLRNLQFFLCLRPGVDGGAAAEPSCGELGKSAHSA